MGWEGEGGRERKGRDGMGRGGRREEGGGMKEGRKEGKEKTLKQAKSTGLWETHLPKIIISP